MHAVLFLHKLFLKSPIILDKRLFTSLFACVDALCRCRHASLVAIGRSIAGPAYAKHKIKRSDRLLGNKNIYKQRIFFYKKIATLVIGGKKTVPVIIDWSGLTPCGAYHLLRAAVPIKGRALTILEKSYPEKQYSTPKAHKEFLHDLARILPEGCKPIILTDAGFRVPWFKLVYKMGWGFVGRVRHSTMCRPIDGKEWESCKTLHKKATTVAKYLGEYVLSRSNPFGCHFYLIRQRKCHRVKKNLKGKKVASSPSKKHERREREAWLIAASLPQKQFGAKKMISLYKLRMGIEESFRDMKNTNNGFGYRHSRTMDPKRIDMLMLIIALASLAVWVLGILGVKKDIVRQLQTNSIRSRRVLSIFILGLYMYNNRAIRARNWELIESIDVIQNQIALED